MKTLTIDWFSSSAQPKITRVYESKNIGVCPKCHGTGIYPEAHGPDDAEMTFCPCPVGDHAEHISANEHQAHGN